MTEDATSRLAWDGIWERYPGKRTALLNVVAKAVSLDGYGLDLLVKGTALLQHKGFRTVVAETDSENLPFHAELERAGYRHHGTLKCFRRDL